MRTTLLLLALPATALAAWPTGPWPDCGRDQMASCPNDFGGRWYLRSWTENPAQLDDLAEPALGSGIGADLAWRHTVGRPEVLIAVLDSGIEWDSWHVRKKAFLNREELPEPEGAEPPDLADPWDLDGDGLLTVDDYAWDLRVDPAAGQDVADHHLDASDLIAVFSDGVDDDGNGYVDDISGWDLHWNDNDPSDDTRFGHGTFEAELSLSEADDGGDIGICPGCSFLPVRVGDAFIADADNIASAILFATDAGARVIQAALGGLGNSPHLHAAMEYAAAQGVVMVMAAGDETSYHPNAPGVNPEALYVKAVRYDTANEGDATTFLNVSNCTNYGPRLDLSAPSTSCASGATGVTSGVAGLVLSAGLDVGLQPPLSVGEVRQLLTTTATDIDVAASRGANSDPDRYPSHPGWELHFGYGRVSAAAAVEAVWSGAIPPEAEIRSPEWFGVWPAAQGTIPISGTVEARRSGGVDWSLQWALGADPRDEGFVEFASGSGAVDGPLGELSVGVLIDAGLLPGGPWARRNAAETSVERALSVHPDAVTVRLVATDAEGHVARARRLFFVEGDNDALPGFPRAFGSSIEASPRAADLDGDGLLDLVIATSGGDVYGWNPRTGEDLPGWPVRTKIIEEQDPDGLNSHHTAPGAQALAHISPPGEGVIATPAIADLDGDGSLEVIAASIRGSLYVWGSDGVPRPGFPVSVDPDLSPEESRYIKVERGFLGSPAVADLDGDGSSEIVAPAMDGFVYVWRADGSLQPGWPVPIVSLGPASNPFNRVVSSPAVGDLDGDGLLDVVVGSNESAGSQYALLFAIHGDGLDHDGPAYLPGFPIHVFAGYVDILPVVGEGMPTSPALADVDGDGIAEIGANAIADPGVIWSATGEEFTNLRSSQQGFGNGSNSDEPGMLQLMNSGTWADLDGDGVPEWINGGMGLRFAAGIASDGQRSEYDHLVAAWDATTGDMKHGFPQVIEDLQFFMNPAVADITNDGRPEVITASGGYLVHAWDVDGVEAPGFPKSARGWIVASPLVADLDGNGLLDLVIATRSGLVFAWSTPGFAWGDVQWPTFHHDNAGTGNLATPLPVVLPPVVEADDCSCHTGGASTAGLLPLTILLLRRRRR